MAAMVYKRRVLVCEDDPAMLRIFRFILQQQGIGNIFATPKGAAVVAMAQTEKPDLILLDLMLPDKDGLTVLKELKSNAATCNMPVVVVSGKESDQQISQALEAGALDYVIKPFDPAEMGLRIRNFLSSLDPSASGEIPPPEAAAGGASA